MAKFFAILVVIGDGYITDMDYGYMSVLFNRMNYKSIIAFALIASVLVFFSLTCNAQIPGSTFARILRNKKIVVAMINKNYPPFFSKDKSGKLVGVDVDLAYGIGKALGVKVEFNRSAETFNGVINLVAEHKADVAISKLSKTLNRSKQVYFTKPYVVLHRALLISRLQLAKAKKSQSTVEFIRNFKGKLAVLKGTSYADWAKTIFPRATVVQYNNWAGAIIALAKGNVIAAFRDEVEAKQTILLNPSFAIVFQPVVFKDAIDPIAIAVSVNSPHLLYWLNHYIEVRAKQITINQILKQSQKMMSSQTKKDILMQQDI